MLDVSTRVPYGVYMTNIYLFMLDHPTVIVAFVAVLAICFMAVVLLIANIALDEDFEDSDEVIKLDRLT